MDVTQGLLVPGPSQDHADHDALETSNVADVEITVRRGGSRRESREDGRGRLLAPSTTSADASVTNDLGKENGGKGSLSAGVNGDESDEEDAYDSCCICFDGKEYVLTSCCHLFCLPCITRWIEISGTCPICRNEFDTGVELYNLIGTVEDTVRAIKEVQKRQRRLEASRREQCLALQREASASASSWGIFHQVMDLLFPASVDGEAVLGRMVQTGGDDDDVAHHLNLTRVSLDSLAPHRHNPHHSHNLHSNNGLLQTGSAGSGHRSSQALNVAPSFPFLSFCCLPQSPASVVMPPFERLSLRNRIH
jgi:hypothetical protein